MIRVKMLRGNATAIVDNGKSYTFDMGGACTGSDVGNLFSYMDGALDLPIISVLTSGDYTEIGVSVPGIESFKRYKSSLGGLMVVTYLQTARQFIKMLRRSGKQDGVRFNQLIFVYREDFDVSQILSGLHVTEV